MAKKRENGEGGLFRISGSKNWYIKVDGRRTATGTAVKQEARNILNAALGRSALGIQSPEDLKRLKYETVRDSLLAEYRNGKQHGHSLHATAKGTETVDGLKHLDEFFTGATIADISTDRLRTFVAHRRAQGAATSTVNRNLALLRRMLNLARQEGKLQTVCHFPMLKEPTARKGFVTPDQFAKLYAVLPEYLQAYFLLLFQTGVRSGEAKKILWSDVDLIEGIVRLHADQTKNAEPRILPLSAEMIEALKKQARNGERVFPVGNVRKSWITACVKAGLGTLTKGKENGGYGTYDGLIIHDLRRSAIRNFVRTGTQERVAMAISGHKTRAVFDRYNIVDETDVKAAMSRVSGSSLGQVISIKKERKRKSA